MGFNSAFKGLKTKLCLSKWIRKLSEWQVLFWIKSNTIPWNVITWRHDVWVVCYEWKQNSITLVFSEAMNSQHITTHIPAQFFWTPVRHIFFSQTLQQLTPQTMLPIFLNPLSPELNPICYLLALLAHHFLHVSRIRVKSLTLRWIMSYIYGAPILDVSRSHTTTQHSR